MLRSGGGLPACQQDLEAARQQEAALRAEQAQLTSALEAARTALTQCQQRPCPPEVLQERDALLEQLSAAQLETTRLTTLLEGVKAEGDSCQSALPGLREQELTLKGRILDLGRQRSIVEGRKIDLEAQIKQLDQQIAQNSAEAEVYQQDIDSLKAQVFEVEGKLQSARDGLAAAQTAGTVLEASNNALYDEIDQLESTLVSIQEETTMLIQERSALQTQLSQTQATVTQLYDEIAQVKLQLDQCRGGGLLMNNMTRRPRRNV